MGLYVFIKSKQNTCQDYMHSGRYTIVLIIITVSIYSITFYCLPLYLVASGLNYYAHLPAGVQSKHVLMLIQLPQVFSWMPGVCDPRSLSHARGENMHSATCDPVIRGRYLPAVIVSSRVRFDSDLPIIDSTGSYL